MKRGFTVKTLTVTLVNHRLTFDIRVFLGAEYAVEFAGEAAALGMPLGVNRRDLGMRQGLAGYGMGIQ